MLTDQFGFATIQCFCCFIRSFSQLSLKTKKNKSRNDFHHKKENEHNSVLDEPIRESLSLIWHRPMDKLLGSRRLQLTFFLFAKIWKKKKKIFRFFFGFEKEKKIIEQVSERLKVDENHPNRMCDALINR